MRRDHTYEMSNLDGGAVFSSGGNTTGHCGWSLPTGYANNQYFMLPQGLHTSENTTFYAIKGLSVQIRGSNFFTISRPKSSKTAMQA